MRDRFKRFGLVGCAVLSVFILFCTILYAGDHRYEIEPEIRLPEHRTDAARAIDAYERMMSRYMALSERQLVGVSGDVRDVLRKLDSMDAKLNDLSVRIGRIEQALGIQVVVPVREPKKATKQAKEKTTENTDKEAISKERP